MVFVGGVGIDITERQILEEQLNQARKMEALGRLAGGVAHDFNNLLTVISGYGQLALEGVGSISDQRMMDYLNDILKSSRRAAGLTGQLLAFSRRQVVEPTVIDLSDLLRNMERLLQRVIGEHVELKVQVRARSLSDPCRLAAIGTGSHECCGQFPRCHAPRGDVGTGMPQTAAASGKSRGRASPGDVCRSR